jgi:hypothetical protein
MSAATPHFAPIVALLFLGTAFLIAASLFLILYGAAQKSFRYAVIGGSALLTIILGYSASLLGASLLSREIILPVGGSKYFCELDCHLGYSITGAQTARALGPEIQKTIAEGKFVVVRVKTWFDPSTISPRRGDGPLTPNLRRVLLSDEAGHSSSISPQGQAALARVTNSSAPLTQSLRPGESYTTDLVFDVARESRGLRLLLTEDDPETRVVFGHENSPLHKKIYLALDSAPPLTALEAPPEQKREQ